jgi:hypothetical protein
MPITVEQITAEFTAQPELKTALIGLVESDVLTGLKSKGLVVRTKDEETEFINNYEKNVIGPKIKSVHDQYDNDLFELTGEKKLPTEKTYEFMKRKLTALKAESKAGNNDPVLADEIKALSAKLKERENYVAPDEVEKIKGKYFADSVSLRLGSSLDKKAISVPAHITDEKAKQSFIETQRRFIKNDFVSRFTAKQNDSGEIVYYEGDKLLTDAKTAAPKTEQQLIDESYSGYFVPDKKPAAGAGSGSGGSGKEPDANEATLKTKEDVLNYLTNKFEPEGIRQGNPKFNSEYGRIIKDYAITE